MFWSINKVFIGLLTGLVNGCNQTKCVSLNNQKCQIKFNLLLLIYRLMNTELHYYPFKVKLDRCVGSCNTCNDLSNKVCIRKETDDLNIEMFKMITEIN